MFYTAFTPLTIRILPCQAGKKVHRFFSLISGRERIKVALLVEIDKWNELRNKGSKLYASNQRYFSENHSISFLRKQLKDAFPNIVQDFVDDLKCKDIPEAVNCFKDTLERNVTAMKDNLPITFLHCYKSMEDPRNFTPQNIKRANILASCLQMLQASTIIVDDIADAADYRLAGKCWHLLDDVGPRALIDNILVEVLICRPIKKYCSHLPSYVPMLQLWNHTFLKLAIGFYLDVMVLGCNGLTLNHYTRERYETLVKYKTTIAAFELPYEAAWYLSGKHHTKIPPEIRDMLIMIGLFFQIQNDFRDCYDEGFESKKTVTDIAEGRGTWVITTALERANSEQRRIFETHYGKKNEESVQVVKDLFDLLEIPRIYAERENKMFDFIEKNYEKTSKLTCLPMTTKRLTHLYEKYL